jgi:hypothetical protein
MISEADTDVQGQLSPGDRRGFAQPSPLATLAASPTGRGRREAAGEGSFDELAHKSAAAPVVILSEERPKDDNARYLK